MNLEELFSIEGVIRKISRIPLLEKAILNPQPTSPQISHLPVLLS
jgi:hypothetical protein